MDNLRVLSDIRKTTEIVHKGGITKIISLCVALKTTYPHHFRCDSSVTWPHRSARLQSKMAEQKDTTSSQKLSEEKNDSEGLSLIFSLGKMHNLFKCTELVQYLCLMYRQHHPKGAFCGGEKKTCRDFRYSQTRRETQNLDESFRISAEEDNCS